MPLQGHHADQLRPLQRRERRIVAVIGALLVASIVVVVVASLTAGDGAPAAGCVRVTTGSTTGGAQIEACGAQARRLCSGQTRGNAPYAVALRSACARARIR